jgi:hypothetical protein
MTDEQPIELSSELITADFDSGFVVRPGDTLVLATSAPLSAELAGMIRERILEQLPGLADVVVLDRLTVQAVYRAEEAQP